MPATHDMKGESWHHECRLPNTDPFLPYLEFGFGGISSIGILDGLFVLESQFSAALDSFDALPAQIPGDDRSRSRRSSVQ